MGGRRYSEPRPGFTWVELLVVLLIGLLLVAILFPLFARPRGPHGPTCTAHLRQLAVAAAMYAQDYNEQYPQAGLTCLDPSQPDGSRGCRSGAYLYPTRASVDPGRREEHRIGYAETWQGGGLVALAPYVKNWEVYWCVRDEGRRPLPTDPRSYYAGFEWLRSPSRVRYPERKVLMLEAYANHGEGSPARFDEATSTPRRHLVAFVDGHVMAMDLATGCSGNPSPACKGWESCMGTGGNRNYVCSGHENGVKAPDFP